MKTTRTNHFLNVNHYQLWKELNEYLRMAGCSLASWLLPHSSRGSSTLQRILHYLVAAVKAVKTGLTALALSAQTNRRLYVGFVMIGVMAPLAGCMYMLFNENVGDRSWYHFNNYYLFFVLGPFFTGAIACAGLFLLFPKGAKRAYILAIPMGYNIGKSIWLYSVISNEEFQQFPPFSILLIALLISAVVLMLVDWLTWRKFHREDAFEKRLDGIFQIADDLPAEKVLSMLKTTWREKKNFQREY